MLFITNKISYLQPLGQKALQKLQKYVKVTLALMCQISDILPFFISIVSIFITSVF